jgi:hypothetical protein
MSNWIKRLFCRHIWNVDSSKYLGRTKSVTLSGYVSFDYFDQYALYQHCVKCDKEKVTQDSQLVIPSLGE